MGVNKKAEVSKGMPSGSVVRMKKKSAYVTSEICCDITPESRESEVRANVHCQPTTFQSTFTTDKRNRTL
jgi:hypothetical protein